MFRFTAIGILFLFLTLSPLSQNNKKDYRRIYSSAEYLFHSPNATEATDSLALAQYQQVASLLIRDHISNNTLVDSYLKAGILLMSKNTQENALLFFQRAIAVTVQNKLPDTLLFKPYLYSGSIHYNLNNLDSAIYYYTRAEVINASHVELNESERLFNKMGALYFETGDYNKSISYFEKALSLVGKKKPLNVFFVINYKNNIATALMKLGRYSQALDIFNEILKLGKPGDELMYNIGNTYFEKQNYTEALKWIRQIRNMNDEKYNSLIKIFIHLKQFDSARLYLAKAGRLKSYGQSKITKGILLKYSGDLKVSSGRLEDAVADYQRAIISLDPAFTDIANSANPSEFSGFQNFLFLFDALVAKASALNEMGDVGLTRSLGAYSSALSLAAHIEKTYFSDDARLFLKTRVNPATRDAVGVAIRLYDKTKDPRYFKTAFSLVENNKATVLQAGLKNLELSAIAGLPANLVAEEKKYRTLLAKLNIQAAVSNDSTMISSMQTRIHETEVLLATIQDQLDKNPIYHNLKYATSTADMDSLQLKILSEEEAILSFYYTDSSLICFYITKEKTGFTITKLDNNFFTDIYTLRKELQTPAASGRKFLLSAGTTLFQQLMKPVYPYISDKKRLVIIPFNEIGYVPFEMLIDPQNNSLMLEKFAISYDYSTGFIPGKKLHSPGDYNVLAMAPFAAGNNSELILPALPASLEEVEGLPGEKLAGPDATKEVFVRSSYNYPILHLATHAVANDSNLLGTYIEFYGLKKDADTVHRLYEQEIYALDLNSARLVILSACETGSGLLINGEGVMSLSRAFSYAGCKSVITSLWKADELSTSFICRKLHFYLRKGLPIDVALQKSKLDYLSSSEVDERYKNPAFWAHLVLIGDVLPVTNSRFSWPFWLVIILGCGLVLFTVWNVTLLKLPWQRGCLLFRSR